MTPNYRVLFILLGLLLVLFGFILLSTITCYYVGSVCLNPDLITAVVLIQGVVNIIFGSFVIALTR